MKESVDGSDSNANDNNNNTIDNNNNTIDNNNNTIDSAKQDGRTCTLKNTLRNGLVIGALESRYDHQVGKRSGWDVDPVQGRGAAGSEAQPDGGELRRADGGEAGGHAGGAQDHQP